MTPSISGSCKRVISCTSGLRPSLSPAKLDPWETSGITLLPYFVWVQPSSLRWQRVEAGGDRERAQERSFVFCPTAFGCVAGKGLNAAAIALSKSQNTGSGGPGITPFPGPVAVMVPIHCDRTAAMPTTRPRNVKVAVALSLRQLAKYLAASIDRGIRTRRP